MSLAAAVLCATCLLSDGASLVRSAQAESPALLRLDDGATSEKKSVPPRESALTAALARAWKRGFIEDGIAGTRNTLIACQRETSLLQIMPFMRSEGQQAHCFRF